MPAIKKILVPTDFSAAADHALRYACFLADTLHASLCIVHVLENQYLPGGYMEYYAPPPEYYEQVEREGRKKLEGLLTPDEQARYRTTLVQRTGGAAHEILQYAREQGDIDLIVMASHGRGGVARLMMGSVAVKIVRSAPCPVLTIRGPEHPVEGTNQAA